MIRSWVGMPQRLKLFFDSFGIFSANHLLMTTTTTLQCLHLQHGSISVLLCQGFSPFRYWTSILHTRHSSAKSTNSYVLLYLVCYLKGTLGAHQCLSYTLYITLKFLFNFVYTGNPSPSTEVPYCKVLTLLILTDTYGTQKCRSTWSIWATWTWFGIKTLKIGSVNANEVKYSFLKSYMNRSSLKDNFIF